MHIETIKNQKSMLGNFYILNMIKILLLEKLGSLLLEMGLQDSNYLTINLKILVIKVYLINFRRNLNKELQVEATLIQLLW
jgi:hypothetical protein